MSVAVEFGSYLCYAFMQTLWGLISLVLSPLFWFLERRNSAKYAPKKPYKSVFITGGSSGLGEGLALHYAAKGVLVAITGRDQGRLEEVAKGIRAKGGEARFRAVNVTDQKGLHAFIDEVDAEVPIDLLIANAGVGGMGGHDNTTLLEEFTEVTDTNLQGVWNTVFPLVERMCSRGYGQVALMSSMSAYFPALGAFEYSAAKSNLSSAGRALRRYCEQFNVSVCTITPGFVRTKILPGKSKYMFEITVEEALPYIVDGLKRNVPIIIFPLMTYLLATFVGMLHPIVYDTIGRRLTVPAGNISKRFHDLKKSS